MSGTSNALLRPLGTGVPLPGGNVPTPRGPTAQEGAQPINMRGPTLPAMHRMVAQPPPQPLGPAAGSGGGASPLTSGGVAAPPQGGSLQDQIKSHMKRAKAAFDNTGRALKQIDLIRQGLDKLGDKQDMVTMEDIVHEAGKLVSHGIDPIAMAGVLADAPQEGGGEALGGWVASHAQMAMQAEQQLIAQHNANAHEMGQAALHDMMLTTMAHQQGAPPPAPTNGNSLSPDQSDLTPASPLQYGGRFLKTQGNMLGG